jgi:hypothetical protein
MTQWLKIKRRCPQPEGDNDLLVMAAAEIARCSMSIAAAAHVQHDGEYLHVQIPVASEELTR